MSGGFENNSGNVNQEFYQQVEHYQTANGTQFEY